MSYLVPVEPGIDYSIPTGPQISAKYVLTGPDGTRVAFNDPSDRDYIGMLNDVTGLDSPEVRESAEDLVQFDGGVHGDFYYGRRPITMSGILLNPESADDRNRRMTKLMRATNAMRQDSVLTWILEDGYEQFVRVRRQQPLRIGGAWQKEFQASLVAADPRIYSTTLRSDFIGAGEVLEGSGRTFPKVYPYSYGQGTIAGQVIIENKGNSPSRPVFNIYGPGTNPSVTNFTSGETLSLTYTLGSEEFLQIDTLNRTVTLGGTASRYSAVNFVNSTWWPVYPGVNDVRIAFASYGAGARLEVEWRDAWL